MPYDTTVRSHPRQCDVTFVKNRTLLNATLSNDTVIFPFSHCRYATSYCRVSKPKKKKKKERKKKRKKK